MSMARKSSGGVTWDEVCLFCHGTGHAGGRLDDPNECGWCETPMAPTERQEDPVLKAITDAAAGSLGPCAPYSTCSACGGHGFHHDDLTSCGYCQGSGKLDAKTADPA